MIGKKGDKTETVLMQKDEQRVKVDKASQAKFEKEGWSPIKVEEKVKFLDQILKKGHSE